MNTKIKNLTSTALLLALSLIIGVLEHMLPPIIPIIPFLRLGLSNIVILFTFVMLGGAPAFTVAVLKAVIVPLALGNPSMMLYSLPATLAASFVMFFMTRYTKNSLTVTGILASILHNITQLSVGALIMNSTAILSYAPYLFIAAAAAGALTGTATYFAVRYFPNKL